MKNFAVVALLTFSMPVLVQAAPVDISNKRYDMDGKISVRAKARCGGHSGAGGGVSPAPIQASIEFGPQNDIGLANFTWFNDTLMPVLTVADGETIARKGNKLTLMFVGENDISAGSALFSLANIPDTSETPIVIDEYSLTAVTSKKKIKVTEQVSVSANVPPCTFKWTIKRKMKGGIVEEPTT